MKKLSILLLAILFAVGYTACNQPEQKKAGSAPWDLAVIAWSFREFTFFETVDKAKEAGIHFLGAFPGQPIGGGIEGKMEAGMSEEKRKLVLDYLAKQDVKLIDFGVYTPDSPEGWRELFAFAKAMDLRNIVSEPHPDDLELVSRLCEEYQIQVAIHNHPSPSHYAHPDTLLAALENSSKYIGACADVGHWTRSGMDPIECLKKLEGRIFEVHFKDITTPATGGVDTIWGTGICNIDGMLKELHQQKFTGILAVEYETNPRNNLTEIGQSLGYYNQVMEKIK
ncbi:Inosose dehydratase [Chitinophaga sp. MM2321]